MEVLLDELMGRPGRHTKTCTGNVGAEEIVLE
jgi:hypothetical protein